MEMFVRENRAFPAGIITSFLDWLPVLPNLAARLCRQLSSLQLPPSLSRLGIPTGTRVLPVSSWALDSALFLARLCYARRWCHAVAAWCPGTRGTRYPGTTATPVELVVLVLVETGPNALAKFSSCPRVEEATDDAKYPGCQRVGIPTRCHRGTVCTHVARYA
eukprot:2084798-Rhodomonas_salina.2